jgi:hypothetical protein
MKPELQKIAIAKACGWKHDTRDLRIAGIPIEDSFPWISPDGERAYPQQIPDYLNDLNAMLAALKSQTQAFRAEFDRLLHALAEEKQLLVTELEAKDWANCFISCLQSQRDSGN